MNERTHFLIKNISLTLYSRKVWCSLCVRGELEMGTDCNILTQFLWPLQHFFRILAGLLKHGSLRAQNPLSVAGSQSGIFSPTDSNCNWNWLTQTVCGTWLYNCLTFTYFLWAYASTTVTEFSHVHRLRWHSDIFDRMHLFRCSSAYLPRCISWLTARSRVNMLQVECFLTRTHIASMLTHSSRHQHYLKYININLIWILLSPKPSTLWELFVWIFLRWGLMFIIFWLWFFKLLSSSLLLFAETQRFGHCIFRPSSVTSCLSGYRNDSTREIIIIIIILERLVWSTAKH